VRRLGFQSDRRSVEAVTTAHAPHEHEAHETHETPQQSRPAWAPIRRALLAAAAFSCALNLLLLAPTIFMMQVFDRVLVSRSGATLVILLAGVGLALLLKSADGE
jgi:ABC-type protease/lipase transport system fused ATPase/permease subunit